MKKAIYILTIMSLALTLMMPAVTFATDDTANEDIFGMNTISNSTGLAKRDPREIAGGIIRAALGLLGVVCVIIIIIGGVRWMTAGGNEENVTKARKILMSGIIGLIIVIAAYAIASFVVESLLEAAT